MGKSRKKNGLLFAEGGSLFSIGPLFSGYGDPGIPGSRDRDADGQSAAKIEFQGKIIKLLFLCGFWIFGYNFLISQFFLVLYRLEINQILFFRDLNQ